MTGLRPDVLGELSRGGWLTERWLPIFAKVDRSAFIPDQAWLLLDRGGLAVLDRLADPEGWDTAVSGNVAITTQVSGDDFPSSSSSQPSIMALMLEALDPRPGDRVLEVGAGTGYNAALLAERVGAKNVTTVEIDPVVADAARRSLIAAGYEDIEVVTGDGAAPPPVEWDKLIATYAVDAIPKAWLANARSNDGAIVAPWRNGLLEQAVLHLDVAEDGTATGRMVDGCSFMSDRRAWTGSQSPPAEGGDTAWTAIGSDYLEAVPISMWLCRDLTGVLLYKATGALFLHDKDTESFAVLDLESEDDGRWEVRQTGPRRIWDELQTSIHAWFDADQPGLDVWQVYVDPDGVVRLDFVSPR